MVKKTSFSYPINRLIVFVFGLAFFLVFSASAVLLFLSEENGAAYYLKAFGIFLVYLVLYIFSVIYVSQKIRNMLHPLDQIATALAQDKIRIYGETADLEIFAEQLSERMEKMEDISDELSMTKDSLNDIWQESEENRSKLSGQIRYCRDLLEHLTRSLKVLTDQTETSKKTVEEENSITTKLKLSRQSLCEDVKTIKESLNECGRFHQDVEDEKVRQKEAFEILNEMQKEAIELIESVYSELAYIQDLASKLELYALNSSMEYIRNGGGSVTVSAALDEMKEMNRRMRDKADDLAMLVIRIKNSVQLANDQTGFCIEMNQETQKLSDQTEEKLSFVSAGLEGLMNMIEGIADGAAELFNHFYELPDLIKRQEETVELAGAETVKMNQCLEEMEQLMKQKADPQIR